MNIIFFDIAIKRFSDFPGYRGNPPTDSTEYATVDWIGEWTQQPTWEQVQEKIEIVKTEQAKDEAKKRIAATDWAVLSDVGLANQSAFVAYRAELRALITNPVAEPTWPVEPEPIWS
jgi:hypothetical protein